jgi:uncharacterized protein (DUF983 family)
MTEWPALSPFTTGLAGRCPRCGQGRLYAGFLTVAEQCEVCGLDLRGHDSGDGPAVFLIFALGVVMMGATLTLEFMLEPPIWVHIAVMVPATLGLALVLLRPLKGVTIAQQYRMRSTQADSDAI